MNKRYLTVALSGITLALTFFGASADQSAGWYYDEDRDTIVLIVEGSRTGIASSHARTPSQSPVVHHSGSWYHDENLDTIVFTVEGSRIGIASSRASTPLEFTMTEQDPTWYYDE